jgi:hypothetical protein
MKPRTQVYVLVGLLAVLTAVVYYWFQEGSPLPIALGGDEKFVAMDVKDPALRLDRLERIRKLAYPGMRRNIFSPELPPPPAPPAPTPTSQPPGPSLPPPPPALEIPFKFYGLAVDPRSGKRRAFFTNGEDIFIASEGDTLLTRYLLLRIGNSSADFEEVGTGRQATLSLEQTPQPPQG